MYFSFHVRKCLNTFDYWFPFLFCTFYSSSLLLLPVSHFCQRKRTHFQKLESSFFLTSIYQLEIMSEDTNVWKCTACFPICFQNNFVGLNVGQLESIFKCPGALQVAEPTSIIQTTKILQVLSRLGRSSTIRGTKRRAAILSHLSSFWFWSLAPFLCTRLKTHNESIMSELHISETPFPPSFSARATVMA